MLLSGWGGSACVASGGGAFRGVFALNIGPVEPTPVPFATTAKVQDVSIGQGGQLRQPATNRRGASVSIMASRLPADFAVAKVVPVKVKELPATPVRIVTSYASACAILETGAVMCWGQNSRGQLGVGDFAMRVLRHW